MHALGIVMIHRDPTVARALDQVAISTTPSTATRIG
jgi:hypothetical protein